MTPQAFCRAVLREYERRWQRASGHAPRHRLRLTTERLHEWCSRSREWDAAAFEEHLRQAEAAGDGDLAASLLVEELLPLWRAARAGEPLPFADPPRAG